MTWYAWFANSAGLPVRWHHASLLFASLWLVYTADRWLDARGRQEHELLTQRHQVHARYRNTVFASWVIVLLGSLLLAGLTLNAGEWRSGLWLLSATGAYLGLVHGTFGPAWFPKELSVSLIYCAGTTLFVWSNQQLSSSLLIGAALFTCLVLLNLLGIASTERAIDSRHHTPSLALGAERLAAHVPLASWTLACAAVCFAIASEDPTSSLFWSVGVASTASAVVFGLPVGRSPSTRAAEHTHALADLALLAPLLLIGK